MLEHAGGIAMSELRKRMIECLQLRGLSERTQESYVRAVRQLSEHYHKSPDLISEEELRQYFLFLKNTKHHSCCVNIGARIAIRGCSFPPKAATTSSCHYLHAISITADVRVRPHFGKGEVSK